MSRTYLYAAAAILVSACGQSNHPHGQDAEIGGGAPLPLETTSKGGPKRAPGFWEISLGQAKEQYCVGDTSEEKYSLVEALSMMGDDCSKNFQRVPTGWRFETVCKAGGTTTTQKGVITGDFRTNYRINQEVIQVPGSSVKGEIVAHRLGACPAPYKPGDQVSSSGMSINMLP